MGRLDVGEMLDGLTPREFDEWAAFMRLEPCITGQDIHQHQWHIAARALAEIVNTLMAVSAGTRMSSDDAVSVDDFLPDMYQSEKPPTEKSYLSDDQAISFLKRQAGF